MISEIDSEISESIAATPAEDGKGRDGDRSLDSAPRGLEAGTETPTDTTLGEPPPPLELNPGAAQADRPADATANQASRGMDADGGGESLEALKGGEARQEKGRSRGWGRREE